MRAVRRIAVDEVNTSEDEEKNINSVFTINPPKKTLPKIKKQKTFPKKPTGETMSDEELLEMIKEADRDGDGLVSEEEFLRIIRKSSA